MAFDFLNLIKYIKHEDEGHNCPICMAQLMYIYDGVTGLFKCLECGYSRKQTSAVAGQHRYDLPVTILTSHSMTQIKKEGWFEFHEPLSERLFNTLVEHDYSADQAANAVIKDLDMGPEETQYFMEKLQGLKRD